VRIKQFLLGAAAGLSGFAIILPGAAPAAQQDEAAGAETVSGVETDAEANEAQAGEPEAGAADAALVAVGSALFSDRCAGCHKVEPGMPSYGGPNLAGIVGRPAASAEKFRYSAAMRNSGLTWTVEELERYLAGPSKKIPGTSMFISVPDAGERAAVVAFLATLEAGEAAEQ
jgi:cytochrome c